MGSEDLVDIAWNSDRRKWPNFFSQKGLTRKMRVYIAGPMVSEEHLGFPAFDAMAAELRLMGHEPVSPADLDREAGIDPETVDVDSFTQADWLKIIRRDLDALLTCDAIVMLEGWHRSTGARAELAVAHFMHIPRLDTRHFRVMER